LDFGSDINFRYSEDQSSLLHSLCANNREIENIKFLIDSKIDILAKDKTNSSALHSYIESDEDEEIPINVSILKYLIDSKSDLKLFGNKNYHGTPFECLLFRQDISQEHLKIFFSSVEYKFDKILSSDFINPFLSICNRKNLSINFGILDLLLECGLIDVDSEMNLKNSEMYHLDLLEFVCRFKDCTIKEVDLILKYKRKNWLCQYPKEGRSALLKFSRSLVICSKSNCKDQKDIMERLFFEGAPPLFSYELGDERKIDFHNALFDLCRYGSLDFNCYVFLIGRVGTKFFFKEDWERCLILSLESGYLVGSYRLKVEEYLVNIIKSRNKDENKYLIHSENDFFYEIFDALVKQIQNDYSCFKFLFEQISPSFKISNMEKSFRCMKKYCKVSRPDERVFDIFVKRIGIKKCDFDKERNENFFSNVSSNLSDILSIACSNSDISISFFLYIVSLGAEINVRDSKNRSLLHQVCYYKGPRDLVVYLIKNLEDPKGKDLKNRSAFHYACNNFEMSLVDFRYS
jgi:ankyrin repeat protein